MKKKVEIDFFKQVQFPLSVQSNKEGCVSFLVKTPQLEENSYKNDLWIYRPDQLSRRHQLRQLTYSGDVGAYWWMDSTTLLFSALRDKKDKEEAKNGLPLTVLYALPAFEAGEAKEFFRLPYAVSDIAFIAYDEFLFTAEYNQPLDAILQAHPQQEDALKALEEEKDYTIFTELPFWANGEGVVNGKRNRLYHYKQGEITPVTDEKTNVEQLRLASGTPFAYYIASRYEAKAPIQNQLFQLDHTNGQIKDLSVESSFNHASFCAAGENLLVYGSNGQEFGINQNGNFYRVATATGHVELLYGEGLYSGWNSVGSDVKMAGETKWFAADDNQSVYWVTTLGGNAHLMNIRLDDGEISQITQQDGCVMEILSTGSGLAFTAMRGLYAPELYLLEEYGEKQATFFNTRLCDSYEWARPEEIIFENGEGNRIQGWVLRPEGAGQDEKSFPAILNIHGGPKTVYGTVLFHEMQYWVAQGYGVFFCNPTGSDGGGDAFADIRGRYGLIDFEDIMQFTDEVLANHDWIDPDRIGVTGGSYGGYMTNWVIGHTKRFRAAASQRSISNWVSMATTTDIGYYFAPDQAGADPWSDIDALWEQSPLKYADKVTTPTLFLHSDEDYRCWMAEAVQMYTALQIHNVPTRLCLFHGENHELSRSGKPKHRIRRLQEITGWFEQYLNR